jgi:hypothetical protein
MGEPFLFEINKIGSAIASNSQINIKSIIVYWLLFLLGNMALFLALFKTWERVKIITFFYVLLSLFSGLFFAVDMLWLKSTALFNLAAILKNFLLSPMFTAIAYIVIEYFHWFKKPS